MATINITIIDGDDNTVNIALESDPPLKAGELTEAQNLAMMLMDRIATPEEIISRNYTETGD